MGFALGGLTRLKTLAGIVQAWRLETDEQPKEVGCIPCTMCRAYNAPYELAAGRSDQADAQQEHQTRQSEVNGNAQAHRDAKPKPPPAEDVHWLEERNLKTHGQPMPTGPLPPQSCKRRLPSCG